MHRSLTPFIATVSTVAVLALGISAPAAGASSTPHSTPRECAVGQVIAVAGIAPGGETAGTVYGALALINASRETCRTGGYVGMGLETRAGRVLHSNIVRVDPAEVRSIVLEPGQRATSLFHFSEVSGSDDRAGDACFDPPRQALVTPPNSYTSFSISWTLGNVCANGTIDMQPLVAD